MSGTGAQLYTALSNQRPTAAQMLKGFRLFYEDVPLIQTAHNFANDTILEAFVGASRVHIVDYGISYGLQWPCLINRLSQRPGGPPHLRITGTVSAIKVDVFWLTVCLYGIRGNLYDPSSSIERIFFLLLNPYLPTPTKKEEMTINLYVTMVIRYMWYLFKSFIQAQTFL